VVLLAFSDKCRKLWTFVIFQVGHPRLTSLVGSSREMATAGYWGRQPEEGFNPETPSPDMATAMTVRRCHFTSSDALRLVSMAFHRALYQASFWFR
jgi:hypothetical protein